MRKRKEQTREKEVINQKLKEENNNEINEENKK